MGIPGNGWTQYQSPEGTPDDQEKEMQISTGQKKK